MKATIQGVDYEVRFRHTTLPGHDVRQQPTLDDAFLVLSELYAERRMPGVAAHMGIDLDADLKDIVEQFVASALPSHTTECFILSARPQLSFERRIVSSGLTNCDKRDNFDRAEGRFNAFEKAIQAFPERAQDDWLDWYFDSPMRKPVAIAQSIESMARLPPAGWPADDSGRTMVAAPDDYGFTRTVISAPGAAIREERIEFPANLQRAIADALAYGRSLREKVA